MKVAVITAIFDDYDTLKPVLRQEGVDVEWMFVTDTIPDFETAEGWTIVYEPQPGVHPNRAAKLPKMLPWKYTDAEASVWIDGSFRIVSPTFVRDVLAFANPIAQFKHPWRDCAYDEIQECVAVKKYSQTGLEAQGEAYRAEGHPRHWGLWATGVIARQHTPEVKTFGERWYHDINTWSYQDQVSHPPALRACGLRPTELPGNHLANQWLAYEGSGRHSHG